MSGGRYFAKSVIIDGTKFDSEIEGKYYLLLREQLNNGDISELVLHPRYIVNPMFSKSGKVYKEIAYEADFQFYDKLLKKVRIVDVKGFPTDEFKILRKLFEYKYPLFDLEVLNYSKTTGWVSLDDYKKIKRTRLNEAKQKTREALERAKEAEKQNKLWQRYDELKGKKKLSPSEQDRLAKLAVILFKKGK